jgi:hypothetical protein
MDSASWNDGERARVRATVRSQSLGAFAADVVICAMAAIIGVTHHSSWILIPSVFGVLAGGWLVSYCRQLLRTDTEESAQSLLAWWRRRGLGLALVTSLPAFIAIGAAAEALKHH